MEGVCGLFLLYSFIIEIHILNLNSVDLNTICHVPFVGRQVKPGLSPIGLSPIHFEVLKKFYVFYQTWSRWSRWPF